jgi:phospholipid transport system substrate-binding protein
MKPFKLLGFTSIYSVKGGRAGSGRRSRPAAGGNQGMRQLHPIRAIAILAVCVVLLSPALAAAKEADAGAFLKALSREASAKLGGKDLSKAQKQENFRQLFQSAFDVPTISRFVLGKYWRSATDAQRKAFTAAFEELQMQRFLPQFEKYDESAVQVESVQPEPGKPDLFRVNSKIIRPEGEPINVVWRVRDTGSAYKILDVVAEGVSMAISLRHEYGEVAKTKGIDGLIKDMQDKSAELAAQ